MMDIIDLFITDDDLTLDGFGEPVLVSGGDCIAQDIKHMIRESRLLFLLLGERDQAAKARVFKQLILLIETDSRIRPGTVRIHPTEKQHNTLSIVITAQTMAYTSIQVTL